MQLADAYKAMMSIESLQGISNEKALELIAKLVDICMRAHDDDVGVCWMLIESDGGAYNRTAHLDERRKMMQLCGAIIWTD